MQDEFEKIRFSIERGRHADALRIAQEALSADPQNAQLWILHAIALQVSGKLREALASAKTAISIDPEDAPNYEILCLIYLQLDQPEDALRTIEAAVRLNPGSISHRSYRARAFAASERWTDALADADFVLEREPDDLDARLQRIDALVRLTRLDEAKGDLAIALRLGPSYPQVHYRKGMLEFAEGDLREARKSLRESLRLNPDDARTKQLLDMTYSGFARRTRFQLSVAEFLQRWFVPYRRFWAVAIIAWGLIFAFVDLPDFVETAFIGFVGIVILAIIAGWLYRPIANLARFAFSPRSSGLTNRDVFGGLLTAFLVLSACATLPLAFLNLSHLLLAFGGLLVACVGRSVFVAHGPSSFLIGLATALLYATQPAAMAAGFVLTTLAGLPALSLLFAPLVLVWAIVATGCWIVSAMLARPPVSNVESSGPDAALDASP